MLINHKVFPTVNSQGLPAAIVSGLGSMAIFRSKIFVYRSPKGKEYPIGPDIILNIFMNTIDRQIDRSQALRRQNLISSEMSDITGFDKAAKYFDTSLLSFQNLTDEERAKFSPLMNIFEHFWQEIHRNLLLPFGRAGFYSSTSKRLLMPYISLPTLSGRMDYM